NCFAGPSSYFAVVDGLTFPQTSRWHLPGQIVHHDMAVHHPDTHQLLYCELSATGLHRLFGSPGVRTIGRLASLSEMGEDFEALARKHFVRGPDATRDQHIEEASAFFSALAQRAGPGDPLVEQAVALYEAADGAVRVGDVCRQLNVGPRQLNR